MLTFGPAAALPQFKENVRGQPQGVSPRGRAAHHHHPGHRPAGCGASPPRTPIPRVPDFCPSSLAEKKTPSSRRRPAHPSPSRPIPPARRTTSSSRRARTRPPRPSTAASPSSSSSRRTPSPSRSSSTCPCSPRTRTCRTCSSPPSRRSVARAASPGPSSAAPSPPTRARSSRRRSRTSRMPSRSSSSNASATLLTYDSSS